MWFWLAIFMSYNYSSSHFSRLNIDLEKISLFEKNFPEASYGVENKSTDFENRLTSCINTFEAEP